MLICREEKVLMDFLIVACMLLCVVLSSVMVLAIVENLILLPELCAQLLGLLVMRLIVQGQG